jgi:hypothetical protein
VVEPVAASEAAIADVDESEDVEPVAASEAAIADMDESEDIESAAVEPAEEGSWRDAWMFVEE